MGVKLNKIENAPGLFTFWCPGCEDSHQVVVNAEYYRGNGGPVWGWNGSVESPTFTPSLLVTSGHFIEGRDEKHCWCTYNAEHPDDPAPFKCQRCHSFIIDGKIQFLSDSSHKMVGQTVEIPDWKDHGGQ